MGIHREAEGSDAAPTQFRTSSATRAGEWQGMGPWTTTWKLLEWDSGPGNGF